MRIYKTITPPEISSFEKTASATLTQYRDIFKRILIGHKAAIELYNLQGQLYGFDATGIIKQTTNDLIERFQERLDLIDEILNYRNLDKSPMWMN
jgi:hypothetical protein